MTIYGRVGKWIESLDGLKALSYRKILPGHGPAGRRQQEGLQQVEKFQNYLRDFSARLEELTGGRKTGEQVIAEMYDRYPALGKRWMVKRNVEFFLKNG